MHRVKKNEFSKMTIGEVRDSLTQIYNECLTNRKMLPQAMRFCRLANSIIVMTMMQIQTSNNTASIKFLNDGNTIDVEAVK